MKAKRSCHRRREESGRKRGEVVCDLHFLTTHLPRDFLTKAPRLDGKRWSPCKRRVHSRLCPLSTAARCCPAAAAASTRDELVRSFPLLRRESARRCRRSLHRHIACPLIHSCRYRTRRKRERTRADRFALFALVSSPHSPLLSSPRPSQSSTRTANAALLSHPCQCRTFSSLARRPPRRCRRLRPLWPCAPLHRGLPLTTKSSAFRPSGARSARAHALRRARWATRSAAETAELLLQRHTPPPSVSRPERRHDPGSDARPASPHWIALGARHTHRH